MGLIAKINVIELRKAIRAAVDDVFSAQCVRDVVFSRMCKEMEDRFEWHEHEASDQAGVATCERCHKVCKTMPDKDGFHVFGVMRDDGVVVNVCADCMGALAAMPLTEINEFLKSKDGSSYV